MGYAIKIIKNVSVELFAHVVLKLCTFDYSCFMIYNNINDINKKIILFEQLRQYWT